MDSYPDLPRLGRVEITRAFLVCHSQYCSKSYDSIHEKKLPCQDLMSPVHSHKFWLIPQYTIHANAAVAASKAQTQQMILCRGSSKAVIA